MQQEKTKIEIPAEEKWKNGTTEFILEKPRFGEVASLDPKPIFISCRVKCDHLVLQALNSFIHSEQKIRVKIPFESVLLLAVEN